MREDVGFVNQRDGALQSQGLEAMGEEGMKGLARVAFSPSPFVQRDDRLDLTGELRAGCGGGP